MPQPNIKQIIKDLEFLHTRVWEIRNGQQGFEFMRACEGFVKSHAVNVVNILKEIKDDATAAPCDNTTKDQPKEV